MNGRDSRQSLIVGIHGTRDGRKAGHQLIDLRRARRKLEKTRQFILIPHDKSTVPPLDERDVTEDQSLVRARKAEIVFYFRFAETLEFMDHDSVPKSGTRIRYVSLYQ